MSQNKSQKPNIIASQAVSAGASASSAQQRAQFEKGVRFYVTCSGVTAAGGADKLELLAYPPGSSTAIVVHGFTNTNMLATAGTWIFDFYPSGQLPSSLSAGTIIGVSGICVPINWGVKVTMGAGNAATIKVDAELIP